MNKLLFTDREWTFETIEKTQKVIERIAKEKYNLDYNSPQLEMVSFEQMLKAYSSSGMPIMYDHWIFGKQFINNKKAYIKGQMGLAYELVINTNPLIVYLLESNTMAMQTLVMCHAICGHGSFFKSNFLFKDWTDSTFILDYLDFAKKFIKTCEYKYGEKRVENVLDCCRALEFCGVDKYKRKNRSLNKRLEKERTRAWDNYNEKIFNDIWRTLPKKINSNLKRTERKLHLPEENILYFVEKHVLHLEKWEREIIRIIRKIAQYFYPQRKTKVMNEGWASFIHYLLMNDLYDDNYINESTYFEFIDNHTAVINQPNLFNLNPYALGFAIFKDIKRICENPTEEDKQWFPDLINKNWLDVCKHAVENYEDSSFILQFLSPKVMRDLKLFSLNQSGDDLFNYTISEIQNDAGFLIIRDRLSKQYDQNYINPQWEVIGYSEKSNKLYLKLKLAHTNKYINDDIKLIIEHLRSLTKCEINIIGANDGKSD